MKRLPLSRGMFLLPSLFTTGSMFLSFFSIIRSIHGDFQAAAWAIFVASFFDLVDGRIARMTKTQSHFGREYDSLVDLASFGLAPAILVYTWTLRETPPIGWIFAFLFFACVALRLARFNIQIDAVDRRRFRGLPSPPAACLLASFVLFFQYYGSTPMRGPLTLVLVVSLALLMVSGIRYRSFKEYDVQKRNTFYILLGVSVVLGVIAMNPEVVIFLGFLIYALSGPVGEVWALRRERQMRRRLGTGLRRRRLAVLNFSKRSGEELKEKGP